jgi:RNA polymerase sigma-70 factor, ECF subfamily
VRKTMADVLQRVAATGDVDAFRQLFESYAPRVKSYMMRQGADANTAEDLAQETLLAVWRKAELYSDDKGNATTWIFTIARNLRIDRLRKELTWVALPEHFDQEASADAAPDAILIGEQTRIRVQRALAKLPADQQQVVMLSFIEGLSHGEIAEQLGLPLGTVKSRLRLAYLKVRDALKDLQ